MERECQTGERAWKGVMKRGGTLSPFGQEPINFPSGDHYFPSFAVYYFPLISLVEFKIQTNGWFILYTVPVGY